VPGVAEAEDRRMSRGEILLSIFGLFMLEIYHLKWIWWEYWRCRKCGTPNKHCSCGPKWILYL
jgi:hypothetical protein